jgi:hypothetical protein
MTTDFKEVKDIEDEWEFMLNRSNPSPSVTVIGGWLQAAMRQIWEFINNVQSTKEELATELMETAAKLETAEALVIELNEMIDTLEEMLTKVEEANDLHES